jgi:septum formation protein
MISRLVLASSSPRRRDILREMGVEAVIVPPDVDEDAVMAAHPDTAVEDLPALLAAAKAQNVGTKLKESCATEYPPWLLASDTMVFLDGRAYGKPADRAEAAAMLRGLSGRTHKVISALHLLEWRTGRSVSASPATLVTFAALDEAEITAYLDTNDWTDKAAAYGIRGPGAHLIAHLDGLESTVAGLPAEPLYRLLLNTR